MHRTKNYLVLNVNSAKAKEPCGSLHLHLCIGAPGSFWNSRCPGCISDQLNIWQKPLQYCKVISLQLIKINGKKKKKEILRVESKWEFSWNPSGNSNAQARQRATVLLMETILKSVSKTFCLQSLILVQIWASWVYRKEVRKAPNVSVNIYWNGMGWGM